PSASALSTAFGWQNPEHRSPDHCGDRIQGGQSQVPLLVQPSSLFGTDKSDQAPAPNPHRSTPPPARTPPRFPPPRLFGRLPPCTPSRMCLAGIRKPLTTAVDFAVECEWLRPAQCSRSPRASSPAPDKCQIRPDAGALLRLRFSRRS